MAWWAQKLQDSQKPDRLKENAYPLTHLYRHRCKLMLYIKYVYNIYRGEISKLTNFARYKFCTGKNLVGFLKMDRKIWWIFSGTQKEIHK